jgi:sn-glycerol 3-phosphate transport system permease protein
VVEFYALMAPLLAATIVLGALGGARLWTRSGLGAAFGVAVGASCGVVGPLLAMKPLRSCTFEAGRTSVDRVLGSIIMVAGGALLLGIAGWFATTVARSRGNLAGRVDQFDKGAFRGHRAFPWIALAPTLAVLVMFLYRPMTETLRLSLYNVRQGAPRTPFKCLDNYTDLIEPKIEWWAVLATLVLAAATGAVIALRRRGQDVAGLTRLREVLLIVAVIAWATAMFGPDYRGVFTTTTILTSSTVILSLVFGLAIAVLVSQKIKGRGVYRTLLIWPYAISPPIAGILFFVMFDPLAGIVGHVVESFTPWELPNYRTNKHLARTAVILASVWKTLGFSILFYIAGLQNVARDTLEAAEIDGANAWQRFRHITIPALAPITFFLIVSNVTYAFFDVFGTISLLTTGGPSRATTDAMYSLVQVARDHGRFGEGAAQSIILFIMVLAVTAWQFRSTGRRVTYQR